MGMSWLHIPIMVGANDPQSSPACLGCRFSSVNRERESEENATMIRETIDSLLREYGSAISVE